MYSKEYRPVIFFSSKRVYIDALQVSYGKIDPRNGTLTQNLFKDSIIDDIGVSDDD